MKALTPKKLRQIYDRLVGDGRYPPQPDRPLVVVSPKKAAWYQKLQEEIVSRPVKYAECPRCKASTKFCATCTECSDVLSFQPPSNFEPRTKRDLLPEDCLCADGWDEQILGTAYSPGRGTVVVYDGDAIINVLVTRDGLSHEEAEEFFSFNIEGAWVGGKTPIFVRSV